MVELGVQKKIDEDLANSGGSLDLAVMGGRSGSTYPRNVKAIMVCDADSGQGGATHATVNLRLSGSRNRADLRLQCGILHYLPVREIWIEHTDVNGLIVFGDQ